MGYGVKEVAGLLGSPAAVGAVVAWVVEDIETFHKLTAKQKKLAFLLGSFGMALIALAISVSAGLVEFTSITFWDVVITACIAYASSQGLHLKDHGKR